MKINYEFEVGDYVKVIKSENGGNCKFGDIKRINNIHPSARLIYDLGNNNGCWYAAYELAPVSATKAEFDAFNKSQVKFKVGDWVKLVSNRCMSSRRIGDIARINNIKESDVIYYDLGSDNGIWSYKTDLVLATTKEIENTLMAEARKKGYIAGVKVNTNFNGWSGQGICELTNDHSSYYPKNDRLQIGGTTVYYNGKWAEIIPQPQYKVGDWITRIPGNKYIARIEKIDDNSYIASGIDYKGNWFDSKSVRKIEYAEDKLATKEQIFECLKAEAIKRNIDINATVKRKGFMHIADRIQKLSDFPSNPPIEYTYGFYLDELYFNGWIIYQKGNWATVVETKPKFKLGDWVVNKKYSRDIGKITKIDDKYCYYSCGFDLFTSVRLATEDEIKTYLLAEAKKRGFSAGVRYTNVTRGIYSADYNPTFFGNDISKFNLECGSGQGFIYRDEDGKWGTVIAERKQNEFLAGNEVQKGYHSYDIGYKNIEINKAKTFVEVCEQFNIYSVETGYSVSPITLINIKKALKL